MSFALSTPTVHELPRIRSALDQWQHDDGPVHVHPGDLGWFALRGAPATADALRVWSANERSVALSLLDGPQLLRFAMDPEFRHDDALAQRIADDVGEPRTGVLDSGAAAIEARGAGALGDVLAARGWSPGEPWTPLRRDLNDHVDSPDLRFECHEPDATADWVRVHWSAFRGTPLPAERLRDLVDGWQAAARTPFFDSARVISAHDATGQAVAVTAVWSAGVGRPGLIEPMGVHRDHRGQGYGTAITTAAAAALREMGSSSAVVCAETTNTAAVSTYVAAGFAPQPNVRDWERGG
ncbi:GNAT family N-acetyltransferase [Ruania alba]|uniref:Acetyltransferase (GNAT) family protein n=1 Tax=Ruania alba TaxID=648782 RepID=A0A1H5HS95_9MICO|nr:GNAT family N-acetyltransferase [Ruania alba]SEE30857.1 Acetyltransferase (GNAT) family protein [Ruania alba]